MDHDGPMVPTEQSPNLLDVIPGQVVEIADHGNEPPGIQRIHRPEQWPQEP
jgi:hypothetical protein